MGDVAIGPDPLPQLAQPAIQGGQYAARVIKAGTKNKTLKPFAYKDKDTMATVGRASAVAQIRGLPNLTGFAAWVVWVVLHVMALLGNRNRFATMVNLGAKYVFWGSHNAIVGESPDVVARVAKTLDSQHLPSKRDAKKESKRPTGD